MSKSTPPRPEIYISATSQDLGECRKLIKEGLLTIGCTPVEQSNFAPDSRSVRQTLREVLSQCDAMVHVVGLRYGAEPQTREAGEFRSSYAQLEYSIAKELGIPVYVFLCGEDFPYRACEPEPETLQVLQMEYRRSLASGDSLFEEVQTPDSLELRIHALQDRVSQLSTELARSQSWMKKGIGIAAVLFVVIGGGLWWLSERTNQAEARLASVEAEVEVQRSYIRSAANAFLEVKTQLAEHALSDEELWEKVLERVSQDSGVPLLDLQSGIDLFVASVGQNENASLLDKALAQFATGEFDSAGDLAFLAAADAAEKREAADRLIEQVVESRRAAENEQRQALILAGQARSAGRRPLEAVAAMEMALAISDDLREENPVEWARLQAGLGMEARKASEIAEGREIHEWLQRSTSAARSALEVFTPESFLKEWGITQVVLGSSLADQALVASGPDRWRLSQESVAAYHLALELLTRETRAAEWALAQARLGLVLQQQALIPGAPNPAQLLEESISALRLALEVQTLEDFPEYWAVNRINMAIALSRKSNLVPMGARLTLVEESVAEYRQALKVYTREAYPEGWANVQGNLAVSLGKQASFVPLPDRIRLLRESQSASRLALEVHTRESTPQGWASDHLDLAIALQLESDNSPKANRPPLLLECEFACREALQVFTREAMPQQWVSAQKTLAIALACQALQVGVTDSVRLYNEGIDTMHLALEVWTKEADPEMHQFCKDWIQLVTKDLRVVEQHLAAITDPQTITDWNNAFAIGRAIWLFGDLDGAMVMENRGMELAKAAGVDVNPELGIWNNAHPEDLNGIAWSLVDPERVDRETDTQLGLLLIQSAASLYPAEFLPPPILDTLAWAHYANGQFAEAVAASQAALDKVPEEAKAEYQDYLDRIVRAVEESQE